MGFLYSDLDCGLRTADCGAGYSDLCMSCNLIPESDNLEDCEQRDSTPGCMVLVSWVQGKPKAVENSRVLFSPTPPSDLESRREERE